MNLLPKCHEEFGRADYWNEFFKKRGKKAFEWYGEYPELCGQISKYMKPKDTILVVGCGNSSLSMDLYDVGYKNITSIDISNIAIKQMIGKNREQRPDLTFECMDATSMTYPDEKFTAVLDKGTLDALMPDNDKETLSRVDNYFGEIARVLKRCGRYLCVTLLQEHILRKVVSHFSSNEFMVRVVRCHEAEEKARETEGSGLPVFVLVATKFPGLPQQVLELGLTEKEMIRLTNPEAMVNGVLEAQQSALVCETLRKKNVSESGEISIDLLIPGDEKPRYTIHVLDRAGITSAKTYAAFIVPQGRERDWMFGTPEGRKELAKNVPKDRLAVVLLRSEHTFESMEKVQEELTSSIKNFAPSSLPPHYVIDYLSLETNLGTRNILYKGQSKINGPYIIEDVLGDGGVTYRRLVFFSNQFTVQSEAKLIKTQNRHKKDRKSNRKKIGCEMVIDHTSAGCKHHEYIVEGATTVFNVQQKGHILVIGLGGGGLCTYFRHWFPNMTITAVDIDEEMLRIAQEWFDFKLGEKIKVEIADGLDFIAKASKNQIKYDAIVFDVDSKDTTLGMSCPPPAFLEPKVLDDVSNCLQENGLFFLNLVCRDQTLRPNIFSRLKKTFPSVVSVKVPEDLNEILRCSTKSGNSK